MAARLKTEYQTKIRPDLMRAFGYRNALQAPRLQKIVLNMGVGEAARDSKKLDQAVAEMARIAGQRPVVCKARRSVANFKLREGMRVGCKVTLRQDRMYEFLDRLVNIALPRVRDFRGIGRRGFDGRGNYAMGLKEQIVFPEIDYDQVQDIRGMDIVICTSSHTDAEARALLKGFNMPFRES